MASGTPLGEQQIRELHALLQLPPEEQRQRLPAFLKKLTPEQVAFLKQQQGGGCPFCLIRDGKLHSRKIYEDETVLAVHDIKPATRGHVLLFPKQHYPLLTAMGDEEIAWLFRVAYHLSKAVFAGVRAEGTNIFVAQGAVAGQIVDHVSIHIIPRWKDDGVHLTWEGKQMNDEEMASLQELLLPLVQDMMQAQQEAPQEEVITADPDEEERIP